MESHVRGSFLDASYPVDECWQIGTVKRLYNFQFAFAYRYCVSCISDSVIKCCSVFIMCYHHRTGEH